MLNYNPSKVPPTRLEAIALLQACWPLLDRIKGSGSAPMELGDYDLAILMGFQKVILAELTFDKEILSRAGLTSSDIMELDHVLTAYLTESIPIVNRLRKNRGD